MFCPNCGTGGESGQKYCRACGLDLNKVQSLVSEQLPAGTLEKSTPEEVSRLLKRKRSVERALVSIGLTGAAVFVVSIVLTIIIKIVIGKGEFLKGGILLSFIIAAAVALALVFYRETLTESLAARGMTDQELPTGRDATGRLLHEPRFETVPGTVTDRTTELLDVERRRTTKEVY